MGKRVAKAKRAYHRACRYAKAKTSRKGFVGTVTGELSKLGRAAPAIAVHTVSISTALQPLAEAVQLGISEGRLERIPEYICIKYGFRPGQMPNWSEVGAHIGMPLLLEGGLRLLKRARIA